MKPGDLVTVKQFHKLTKYPQALPLWQGSFRHACTIGSDYRIQSGYFEPADVAIVISSHTGAYADEHEVELLTSRGARGWTWPSNVMKVSERSQGKSPLPKNRASKSGISKGNVFK